MSPEVGELDLEALSQAVAEDPDSVVPLLTLMSNATDETLRARVKALVPRIVVERARSGPTVRVGSGRLHRIPADRGGDLDVDASMDAVVEAHSQGRAPTLDELTATTWQRPGTALCLLVDRSGSMEGTRLAVSAMAAAACALRVAESDGELAVVAFDRRAEVVAGLGEGVTPYTVVERVLRLRGHGMTSLDAALRAAATQLAGARARRRVTVLLSDCRVTDDLDPLPAARSLDELLVVAPASDPDEARSFSSSAGARMAAIEELSELPAALDRLLRP